LRSDTGGYGIKYMVKVQIHSRAILTSAKDGRKKKRKTAHGILLRFGAKAAIMHGLFERTGHIHFQKVPIVLCDHCDMQLPETKIRR